MEGCAPWRRHQIIDQRLFRPGSDSSAVSLPEPGDILQVRQEGSGGEPAGVLGVARAADALPGVVLWRRPGALMTWNDVRPSTWPHRHEHHGQHFIARLVDG